MIGRLEQSKTLSVVDDAALYQYVELHAETEQIKADNAAVRKLSADLKRHARKLEGSDLLAAISEIVKLQIIIAKHTQQSRQGHLALRQFLLEFGMTPAARTRVKVTTPVERPQGKLVAFLGGKAQPNV
jgi:hypothetical protein